MKRTLLFVGILLITSITRGQEQSPSRVVTEKFVANFDSMSTVKVRADPAIYFLISPDKRRIAYIIGVKTEAGGRKAVVVDGVIQKPFDEIGTLSFSPDSQRVAYRGRVGKQWTMVVDEVSGSLYDEVSQPVFSSNSKHVAYKAKSGTNWFIVADGKENKPYTNVSHPFFTPNNRLGYFYSTSTSNADGLVVSDKEINLRNELQQTLLPGRGFMDIDSFPSNGDAIAIPLPGPLGGATPYKWLILDGEDKRIEDFMFSSLINTPNAKRVELRSDTTGMTVAVDGKEGPKFVLVFADYFGLEIIRLLGRKSRGIEPFRFSPDNKRYAYTAIVNIQPKKYRVVVVLDGQTSAPYEAIGGMSFSPDSKRFAYIAAKTGGDDVAVVDGKEGPRVGRIGSIVFSPDSKRVAVCTEDHFLDQCIVEGLKGRGYDGVGDIGFTEDSRHVFYLAQKGEKFRVVVDGNEGKDFWPLLPTPTGLIGCNSPCSTIHYFAAKRVNYKTFGIYLVEEQLK